MGFGDDLLVTGHIRTMQRADPRKVRIEYGKPLWSEVFDHNPRIAQRGESGDFQIYHPRVNNLRPYATAKDHTRWTWQDYKPEVGEIYLQAGEIAFGERYSPEVIIEPNVKGKASPNKQWGRERWVRLVGLLRAEGIAVSQLGGPGTQTLPGVKWIETQSFRMACAVLARARAVVTHEGGMHHAAAAMRTPAVVIYGGFISPAQTGYATQANFFTGVEPCGWRTPCKHCEVAMAAIRPETVMAELIKMIAR